MWPALPSSSTAIRPKPLEAPVTMMIFWDGAVPVMMTFPFLK